MKCNTTLKFSLRLVSANTTPGHKELPISFYGTMTFTTLPQKGMRIELDNNRLREARVAEVTLGITPEGKSEYRLYIEVQDQGGSAIAVHGQNMREMHNSFINELGDDLVIYNKIGLKSPDLSDLGQETFKYLFSQSGLTFK